MQLYHDHYMVDKGLQRVKTKTAAVISAVMLMFGLGISMALVNIGSASAATSPVGYTTTPFTPTEVAQWVPDRTSPTGGYESTSYAGRNNVLEIRIDGDEQSDSGFHQTEGLQRDIPDSDSIRADVYVDAAWGSQTVRAGLWGVAHDATDAISSYPIIEYSTDGTNGWRYWSVNQWINLPGVTVNPGWNTLAITHDDATNTFAYLVNGVVITTSPDEDSATIAAAILNSKNYAVDYAAHWSNFSYGNVLSVATTKDQCKNNGWMNFADKNGNTFKNQGLCVASVQSSAQSKFNR